MNFSLPPIPGYAKAACGIRIMLTSGILDGGGLKGAVRSVAENMGEYTFVFRTDVKSYYDSIDHHILISKLGALVKDVRIIGFVWKYLNRVVEHNGVYQDVKKGIPMGSSLSPLLGAFYLESWI